MGISGPVRIDQQVVDAEAARADISARRWTPGGPDSSIEHSRVSVTR